jgi:ABC-2 type transport system permease protein
LLWVVPLLAFFAAAAGVGVGGLVRSPAAAVGLVLLWAYVAETAVGYLPGGVTAQGFMPFLGSVYATGQDIAIAAPWGPNGTLVYVCALFTGLFAVGTVGASH